MKNKWQGKKVKVKYSPEKSYGIAEGIETTNLGLVIATSTDWEREFSLLQKYTERLEKQLEQSMDLNNKLLRLMENGNITLYERIQKE